MNRYSWHTPGEKTDGGWYKCDAVIIFPGNKVGFKSYPFFKPNRKGGHKHNHVYNAFQRAVFRRSIERRACKCEREFKSIFFTNMALQRNSGDFIKLIFHGRRKNG